MHLKIIKDDKGNWFILVVFYSDLFTNMNKEADNTRLYSYFLAAKFNFKQN